MPSASAAPEALPTQSVVTARLGKRGTLVIPDPIRRQLAMREGDLLIVDVGNGDVVLRPAAAVPVELYSAAQRVEFLLANAIDAGDWQRAMAEAQAAGVNGVGLAAALGLKAP